MKIRILHVVQSLNTGGLENGIVNLINYSNKEDFIIDVLCLRSGGALIQRIGNENSHIYYDDHSNQGKLAAIKKVYALCKKNEYDIIHSHGFATMLAAYFGGRLAKCPCIINGEHGTLYYSNLKQRLIQRYLFNKVKLNLTVSATLKTKICQIYSTPPEQFKTILNGVDSNLFYPNKRQEKLRHSLVLSEDNVVIGSVGRLVEVKNYPSLIRAMKSVSAKFPEAILLFVGDGPEYESLQKKVDQAGINSQVKFLGRRDDIPNLLSLFDVFVLPSFCEGLSNTILESMACGTPVVASRVGGNVEIIDDGETGHLYTSDDSEELAEVLLKLVADSHKRKLLGQQARRHIEKQFSLSSMVKNYEQTYYQLVDNKASYQ
mgnify:CR=1 FL=1